MVLNFWKPSYDWSLNLSLTELFLGPGMKFHKLWEVCRKSSVLPSADTGFIVLEKQYRKLFLAEKIRKIYKKIRKLT